MLLVWILACLHGVSLRKPVFCSFPPFLQSSPENVPWHRNSVKRPSYMLKTYVFVNGGHLESRTEKTTPYEKNILSRYNQTCIETVSNGKYLVKHEEEGSVVRYACVQFIRRSTSVIQIRTSDLRHELDLKLCQDSLMYIDPWPLISPARITSEYSTCPIIGGFNLKVKNSNGEDNGCNYKELPMRFESECIRGEGLLFDFRSAICVGKLPMETVQKAVCVTHWTENRQTFIIIKRQNTDDVWCLRISDGPSRSMTAHLMIDVACPTGDPHNISAEFFLLILEQVAHLSLCDDEYPGCSRMPCGTYFERECQKSCASCDPNIPPDLCRFSSRFRGQWYQRDAVGGKEIDISSRDVTIKNVGTFKCIDIIGSPAGQNGKYTTVSLFDNGCRPRYTCISFEKHAPSVLKYSLSQSIIWPIIEKKEGHTICDEAQFRPDVNPVGDAYRASLGAPKPVVSTIAKLRPVSCNLPTTYIVTERFGDDRACHGGMYQDCDDPTRMRIHFDRCKERPTPMDYYCLSVYEGHYWEKIILMQNLDDRLDVRCLIFSQIKSPEVIVMPGSMCDKLAWSFVDGDVRKPLSMMTVKQEISVCRQIPPRPSTIATTSTSVSYWPVSVHYQMDNKNRIVSPTPATYAISSHNQQKGNEYDQKPVNSNVEKTQPVISEKNNHSNGCPSARSKINVLYSILLIFMASHHR